MESPEFFVDGFFGAAAAGGTTPFSPANRYYEKKPAENINHFTVDDLLDFSKADEVMTDAFFDNAAGNSTDSSTVTAVDSCNSSVSGGEAQLSGNFSCRSFADAQFSGELCVPYDDLAELEWLSNFVEDSFSSDEFQNLQLISATKAPTATSSPETTTTTTNYHPIPPQTKFPSDVSVPGKARSKRSRAAPCDWSSRLLLLSSPSSPLKTTPSPKKRDPTVAVAVADGTTPGRRCLHCGSEKTPQWRAGPLGPKTLCNACGVRFKSGRLVPEYRPAASPTFVSAKHSNSHRKVLELRRQKEVMIDQMQQQQQFLSQGSIFAASNGGEYLIGPDRFRHLM